MSMSPGRQWQGKIAYASLVVLVSLPGALWGQVQRDEGQRLLDEQRARSRDEALSRPQPQVATPEHPSASSQNPADLVETTRTFLITDIALVGDRLLSTTDRDRIVSPFIGLELGPKRLDLLLRKLTAAYIDRGYVTTRAYLGPQNLASGKLEITVVNGTVEQIRIDDRAEASAWPLASGEPLQLTDIEQTVDQINRLRSRRAEASIQPGQTPGGSVIVLDTHPDKPWRVSLGTDNYGQTATGVQRRRLGAEWDNLFGVWDSWAVTDVESADAKSQLLAVSVPFGYGTASYAYAHANSRVELFSGIVSRTETSSHTLGWNHVVARSQQFRHALDLTLVLRDTRRRIDDIALMPQQQVVSRLAGNTLWRGQRGALSAELGYSRGLKSFGGDGDTPNLPSSAPHFEFEKWDANLSLAWTINSALAWRTQLSGQTARTGLPGADQIYLGGVGSIRGFREGIVVGDCGAMVRNELQWINALPDTWSASGWRLDPYAFWDAGVARHLSATADQELSALGLGARAFWKGVSAEVIWGVPQTAPAGIPRSDYFNFTVTLQL